MEAAGLAVGVVPLVVGALKAYQAVHEYLRIFQHYAGEIRRLFNRFEVRQWILEKELDFIIQKAAKYGRGCVSLSAADLIAHADSPTLVKATSRLDEALRKLLCDQRDTFKNLLIGITEQLRELQTELKCFEIVKKEQAKGETMKQTILRVKARIKIGFDKRRLKELLDNLRNDNEDLRRISSYLVDVPSVAVVRKPVRTMPAEVLTNRGAFIALHESLRSCWTCVDQGHAEHMAKLCLGTSHEKEGQQSSEVRLDLAVACLPKACTTPAPAVVPSPIWLYVRTITEIPGSPSRMSAKRPRVDSATSRTSGRALTKHGNSSVCESLSKCRCKGKSKEACLSYLQPNGGLRHLFYHHCTPQPPARSSARSFTLASVLPEIRTGLSLDQQFALSHQLALSSLELYKSPWLPERWRVSDISTFARPSADDSLFVRQLHVTSAISKTPNMRRAASDSHWALADANRSSDVSYIYSIGNGTLFSLGVALLEIAHGAPLEDFRQSTDPNLLCTVQRLSQRGCLLGEKYRQLALQCLRCDFGRGTELELRGLQDAVYTDVVGQLDELMAALRV